VSNEQKTETMWLIRENRSGEYVAKIAQSVVVTTPKGKYAMHWRHEGTANEQAGLLNNNVNVPASFIPVIASAEALL